MSEQQTQPPPQVTVSISNGLVIPTILSAPDQASGDGDPIVTINCYTQRP